MKKITIVILILITSSCSDLEFSSIYPANPPVNIEIHSLSGGDYLLLFRSENIKNARFGGFFVFIDPTREDVLQMETEGEASYILGTANNEDSSIYNTGIDAQIAVLFSDTDADEITVDGVTYTVTTRLDKKAELTTGNWLTIRTYLYNSTTEEIIEDEVSLPGNPVEILP